MKIKTFKLDPNEPARLSAEAQRHYDQTLDDDIDYSDIPDCGNVEWSTLRLFREGQGDIVSL